MNEIVRIVEVGPRDGLQNEPNPVPTSAKIELINQLAACGIRHIEATSFVNPRWVPQLADAAEVMDGITRAQGVTYCALVPNLKGMEAAQRHQADEVAVFAAASEAFSQKNINCSIAESLERFVPIMALAAESQTPVRGYVSTIVDCPYAGPVAPPMVVDVVQRLLDLGCYEVSLGDTLGKASPSQVEQLLEHLLIRFSPDRLAGHFHDTSGQALDNIKVCLAGGIRTFDASVGGLGGCPYAPGAQGNVATEAVCKALADWGYETGIDPARLATASAFARQIVVAETG